MQEVTPHPVTLVLLPGLHGSTMLFEPLRRVLPADLRVLALSYPDDPSMGFDALAKRVEADLPDGPVALVGESFSGPIAWSVASRLPGKVSHVVMAESFVANPQPVLLALAKHLPLATLMRLPLPHWIIRLFALGLAADREACETVRLAIRGTSRETLAARVRMIATLRRPTAPPLQAPALYLRGSHDVLVPPWAISACRAALPHLTVTRLPCPHLTLQACPTECSAAITHFIGYDASR